MLTALVLIHIKRETAVVGNAAAAYHDTSPAMEQTATTTLERVILFTLL